MSRQEFVHRSTLPVDAATAFRWHTRPGAFERLTPPWESVEVLSRQGDLRDGDIAELRMRTGPMSVRWVAEHQNFEQDRQFEDVQRAGPFQHWRHTHRFERDGENTSVLEDRIEYELPLGRLGSIAAGRMVRSRLQRVFAYRHRITAQDLAMQASHPAASLSILLSGSSGLVGSALAPLLTTAGHRVRKLVRSARHAGEEAVIWDPESDGGIDPKRLAGLDAVVHLAGEPIASGRWSAAKKRRIRESRVVGTRRLCEALAAMDEPPQTLVSASAIGYYGDRGDELLDEQSAAGSGFLAEVCRDWENSTEPAKKAGIRVVNLRFGVILSPAGGALAKMLLPFKLGAGGVLGSGRQYMSWIALDDVIGAIYHALLTESLRGPVNCVSPQPVTNREFTKTLGQVLHRPTVAPMPAFAARLALGEMADELLLASQRVQPAQLADSGYSFRYPELNAALRHLLGR